MKLNIIVTTFLVLVLLGPTAVAVPGVPNQFFGEVLVNGRSASDGTSVSAWIDGEVVSTTTTSDGAYNLIVEDPDNQFSGEIVSFTVDGQNTGLSETFSNGAVDSLDLSITSDSGTDGSGSSRSNGAGGIEPATEHQETDEQEVEDEGTVEERTIKEEDICRERWVCDTWSDCVDGFQTRSCTEVNECGTDTYKPHEVQPCIDAVEQGITGLFFTMPMAIILGVLALLGTGITIILRMKKP